MVVFIILFLSGCQKEQYFDAQFSSFPINLDMLNTAYNDYNSNIGPGRRMQITFSSDRNGEGHFDFVVKRLDMEYQEDNGELLMANVDYDTETVMYAIVEEVNTEYNEFGPHTVTDGERLYLLYANDQSGSLDIRYIICEETQSEQMYFNNQSLSDAGGISRINTEFNEAYPCIDNSTFYYCTDRFGDYDIGFTAINETFIDWLQDSDSPDFVYPEHINSSADDKCPFVVGNLMVFTSNREGGYGGYDLYYCCLDEDGQWSEPVNFGPEINSEADEFRPVVSPFGDFENDMMIFSSNREGGYGGFDLYYVGISKMINLQGY